MTTFNDDIFKHCNEEFTYLFSDKKWLVAGYGSQDFVDLKTIVNFSKSYMLMRSLQEKIKEVSIKHENLGQIIDLGQLFNQIKMDDSERQSLQSAVGQINDKADNVEDVLDKHTQTMRKRCYSLMERYNKENESVQRFVKAMVKNEPSFSTVETLASEQRSIILSESLSDNLKDKKTLPSKIKI